MPQRVGERFSAGTASRQCRHNTGRCPFHLQKRTQEGWLPSFVQQLFNFTDERAVMIGFCHKLAGGENLATPSGAAQEQKRSFLRLRLRVESRGDARRFPRRNRDRARSRRDGARGPACRPSSARLASKTCAPPGQGRSQHFSGVFQFVNDQHAASGEHDGAYLHVRSPAMFRRKSAVWRAPTAHGPQNHG